MYDAEAAPPASDVDPLSLQPRLAAVEPVRALRSSGEVYDSPMLGRLEFARMPQGRPSFWRGEQRMPDSRFPLRIVCEVEGDDLPGSDQVACVTAFRRLQVQDAMLCAPLINERLRTLHTQYTVSVEDLVLASIHLPPRPLAEARFELGFRATSVPQLTFTVVFVRGTPRTVRIDSDT
ncbi:MAG TPA: hypothetical protein VH183_11210 [Burkholderiaceae bacterium]|jgi:hypothetical protein|nr:hypothetical protein [Burkholderiaceae bacterium]